MRIKTKEFIIKYKNYAIRLIPDSDYLIAIPEDTLYFVNKLGSGFFLGEVVKEMKDEIDSTIGILTIAKVRKVKL